MIYIFFLFQGKLSAIMENIIQEKREKEKIKLGFASLASHPAHAAIQIK